MRVSMDGWMDGWISPSIKILKLKILTYPFKFVLDDVTRPIDPAAWLQHSEAVRGMVDCFKFC